MRITKHGNACIRVEDAGRVVVVDPGACTERDAVDGATAVLVTAPAGTLLGGLLDDDEHSYQRVEPGTELSL